MAEDGFHPPEAKRFYPGFDFGSVRVDPGHDQRNERFRQTEQNDGTRRKRFGRLGERVAARIFGSVFHTAFF